MISALDHVVLFCKDAEAARRWYEQVGFTYLRGHEGMHWLGLGGIELMLHPADQGPSGQPPMLHARVNDLDALLARCREAGLKPGSHQQPGVELTEPMTMPWGARQFELVDPDGHPWGFLENRSDGDAS
ncbi:MAG: VOC family protein [Acidobacteriota bacterium]